MIPISLDPAATRLAVAGRGASARRRVAALRAGGASRLLWFAGTAGEEPQAGVSPLPHLPAATDLVGLHALWVSGLAEPEAAGLAALARSAGVLVNVEDVRALCDFHSVAELRRGDLLLTVSTGGGSPGLAGLLRADLARRYGPEWAGRLAGLARLRARWRRLGFGLEDMAARTRALVARRGWLA